MSTTNPTRILVVGGGAGGLVLATRLAKKLKSRAAISLVDPQATHLWKPLLHEIAAGSMDPGTEALPFMAQAKWMGFTYIQGAISGLNREQCRVSVTAVYDDEDGSVIFPERSLHYDYLVIAVGSQSNDFGVPGVTDYAIRLDAVDAARRFHHRLLAALQRNRGEDDEQGRPQMKSSLPIVIIGAGATGVELSAELRMTLRVLASYGVSGYTGEHAVDITLVEAASRVLPGLPNRISKATLKLLSQEDIKVMTNVVVSAVQADSVITKDGTTLPSQITVWAAGIKAPEILSRLDGLQVNRINQLVVNSKLQTTCDKRIYAIGDCAQCEWLGNTSLGKPVMVPPRAQAANQQAIYLSKALIRELTGGSIGDFRFNDFGSLISLGRLEAVGALMGNLGGRWFVEGWIARLMYLSLYKRHQIGLYGLPKVILDSLANRLRRRVGPKVKLH